MHFKLRISFTRCDKYADNFFQVKIDDLVEIAMNLRTENAARVRDVIEVRKLVTKMKKQLQAGIADGKSDLSSAERYLRPGGR